MHQSIPAESSPPPPPPPPPPASGYCGAFARLFNPGGGAFENFALLGGRAFPNPGKLLSPNKMTSFAVELKGTPLLKGFQ